VPHLPAGGEIVLFDRSWYNRAGVEHVMEFCSEDEYEALFKMVPEFERMLALSGIKIIKYWFSSTDHLPGAAGRSELTGATPGRRERRPYPRCEDVPRSAGWP
jgi:hypothetical protein